MALRMPVKIGNITHLSDARYGAGMGVDYLGFPVGNGISFDSFEAIAGWVSGPGLIIETPAVTFFESHLQIPHVCYQIELRPDVPIGNLPAGSKWIISGASSALLQAIPDLLKNKDRILFLETSDPQNIRDATHPLLSTAFPIWARADSVADMDLILNRKFAGISLRGSGEQRPGLKTYGALADILEALEVND